MSFTPRIGMYVRCPYNLKDGKTIMLYGRIDWISPKEKAIVKFFDLSPSKSYSRLFDNSVIAEIKDLERVPVKIGTRVRYGTHYASVLPTSLSTFCPDELFAYHLEIVEANTSHIESVTENQLEIHMTRGELNPLALAKKRQRPDPSRYFCRSLISRSQAVIRNSPSGFKSLLGTRAYLYPHQIDTIIRALSERPFRLMLADEVGLGKTIEACAILKGLMESKRDTRAIIIVPDTLRQQWASELWTRFLIRSVIWEEGMRNTGSAGVFIVSYSVLNSCYSILNRAGTEWNIAIIDEAHKLLIRPQTYDYVFKISCCTANVLLLSATPVFRHSRENKMLLSLLEPKRYAHMPDREFSDLASQQRTIRDVVFSLARDLPDYIQYDLKNDYIEKIQDIQTELNDPKLEKLLVILRTQDNEIASFKTVKTILAYLSEYHRIDRNVIRHRKNEIPDAHAPRRLVEIEYSPAGAAEGFWEQNCLDTVSELFKSLFSGTQTEYVATMCKRLLQATSSSPHAVLGIARGRTNDMGETLNRFFNLIELWKTAYDRELEHIEELKEDPLKFHSKIARLIEWIDQNDRDKGEKYLIFSEYQQTAKLYEKAFSRYFGENSACLFCRDMSDEELANSVNAFQNTAECRFLICDASGGEGRNFQVADYIVHCDISWSPAVMEQRIGRLDRIGRSSENEVTSVVIHSEYGVEHDLFELYNKGLNVFTRSLCGMEMAFEEIQARIDKAFTDDPEHGLKESLPDLVQYAEQIEAEVEQERYFDMARQLDEDMTDQLDKLVRFFSLEDEKPLTKALARWATTVGIPTRMKRMSYDGSSTVLMDLENLSYAAMRSNIYGLPFRPDKKVIYGTFSRESAVRHEKLYFMAPSNALYDSLAINAEENESGAAAAIHFDCGIKWRGFNMIWNVTYDYSSIIEKKLPTESLSVLSRFLPVGQVSVLIRVPSISVETDEHVLSALTMCLSPECPYPFETGSWEANNDSDWEATLSSACQIGEKAAKSKYGDQLDIQRARDFLETQLAASRALRLRTGGYSSSTWITSREDIDLFLRGMEQPIFTLDSIAYITTD